MALLVAGVLPVMITGYRTQQEQERTLRAEALNHAQQTAKMLTGVVGRFADALQDDMRVIAGAPDLRAAVLRGEWAAVQRALEAHTPLHPRLRGTVVVDAGGITRAATGAGAPLMGMDLSERPSIAGARRLRGPVITGPFPSPSDWQPVILSAIPILDGDRIAAILGSGVALDRLIEEIQRVRIGEAGFATLQTAQGWIIAHPDRSQILELAPLQTLAPLLLQRGPTGALEITRPDGTLDFAGYDTVPGLQWVVVTHIPAVEALASLATLQKNTWTLLAWLLAMAFAFALFHGRLLARPINALAEAAQAIGGGDLSRRVPAERCDEIGELARAFNAMADRRQQAEAGLQGALARLEALNQLTAAIAGGTDQGEVMRHVVAATASLLGTPYAVLWTAHVNGVHLIPAAEYVDPRLGPLPPQPPIPCSESLAVILTQEGMPVTLSDVRRDPRWENKSWPGLERLGAYVGVPLLNDGDLVGVLAALDQPGRAFADHEVGVLRSLATHAALAIGKARLLKDAHDAAERAQVLVEVGKLLTETVDLDLILTRVVEKAAALLGAPACAAGLLVEEENRTVLRFRQAQGVPQAHLQDHVLQQGEGVAGKAIREMRPVWSSDVLADPQIRLTEDSRRRIQSRGLPRSILAAPMLRGHTVMGVLAVYREIGAVFAPQEVEALTALASQAAIAIQNARLYSEATDRATRLSIVNEVGRAIAHTMELDRLFPAIIEQVRRAIPCVRASLAVPLPEDNRFRLAAVYPEDTTSSLKVGATFAAEDGWTGQALHTRRPVLVRDRRQGGRPADALMVEHGILSTVHLPILAGEACLGVLNLHQDHLDGFSAEQVSLLESLGPHLATALQNASAFGESERRAREAAALAEVGRLVSSSLNMDSVLTVIVEQVRRLMGAPFAGILALDPDRRELAYLKAAGLSPEHVADIRLPVSQGIAGLAMAQRAPVHSADLLHDPRYCPPGLAERQGFRSLLCVPLLAGEEALGLIVVFRPEVHEFTPAEVQLLSQFAGQAAIAIQNARLYGEAQTSLQTIQRQHEASGALLQVSQALARTLDLDEVLDLMVEKVLEVTGADACGISRITPKGDLEHLRARGFRDTFHPPTSLPRGEGLMGRCLEVQTPLSSRDVLEDPGILYRPETRARIQAEEMHGGLAVPIVTADGPYGVLFIGRRRPHDHTPDEIGFAQALAAQAAIAIQNARLYEQERTAALNAQVQRERAEALAAVGQAISASLDVDQVLKLVVERAATVTGADAAAVMQREADTGNLRFRQAHGLREEALECFVLLAGKGIVGVALAAGQAAWTRDLPADPRFQGPGHILPLVAAEGLRAVLSVPIRGNTGPYGALSLFRRTPHDFDDGEIAFAARIADQVAIAIENARLFTEAVQRRDEAEALQDMGRLISSTLDQEEIFRVLIERTCRVLGVTRCALWESPAEGDELRHHLRHSVGLNPRNWDGARLRLGEGVTGGCLARRAPVWTADFLADPALGLSGATLERARAEGYRSICAAPILLPDGPFGALVIYRDDVHAFDAREVALLSAFADQAAIAIENAHLFQGEQTRRRQLEALREVSQEITRELDLTRLLEVIHRRAQELVGGTSGTLSLWDAQAQVLVPAAWHGLAPWMPELRFQLGEGLAGVVAERRKGMYVNDYRSWPSAHPVLAGRTGITASVAEPLIYRDQLLGVIAVNHEEAGRGFTERDRELLALLAAQAATAIQNARLFQEEQARRRQVEAVRAVAEEIVRELDLTTLLGLIARRATELVGTSASVIYTWDPDAEILVPSAWHGFAEWIRDLRLRPGEGLAGAAALRRERVRVDGYRTSPYAQPLVLHHTDVTAAIAEPLLHHDRLVGVIVIANEGTERPLTERACAILSLFAAQAATAIENARLYEESRRQAREATALAEVGRALSESLDTDRVLDRITVEVRQMMDAAFVGVTRLDEDGQELTYVAGVGLPRERFASLRIGVGKGITGVAVVQRKPIHIPDLRTDPRVLDRGIIRAEGYQSLFCAPLMVGNQVLGSIDVFRREAGYFTPAEVQLLTRFADQAAMAIENARLYQQVAAHAETLERRVRERTAELEAANRAKSEFLANMSHELRTPLNAIIGFSELLQRRSFGPLNEKQERYTENIHKSGLHLLNLVNDILDLAKVEAGRLELQPEPTAVSATIGEALESVRHLAETKGLTLRSDVEPGLPILWADPLRLRQMLVNLLSNAVKFTPAGGRVTLRAQPSVGTRKQESTTEGWVEIQVEDSGIGISPEDLDRLFRKFEQLESGLTKTHQGTGLGLALTKRLVELHGGTIAAASPGRGQGATFTLRLPVKARRQRPVVLTVDDDPTVREMFALALDGWGWEGAGVPSLAEARDALARAMPDLVILDLNLPDGSGLEFVRELRGGRAPHVPILMFTGLGASEGQAAQDAGADDFLVKPAPLEVIHRRANRLLARAGWPAAPREAKVREDDIACQGAGVSALEGQEA